MPEIESLSREEAIALAGLAPHHDDSGTRTGERQISGGRKRLRTSLCCCVVRRLQVEPQLVAFYQRLIVKGKSHKKAFVACARKLLIFLNTVVARRTPSASNTAEV
jgi:transposase